MSTQEQAEALNKAKQCLRQLVKENSDEAAEAAVKWIAHFTLITLVDKEMLV